jgi:hypothetical protein
MPAMHIKTLILWTTISCGLYACLQPIPAHAINYATGIKAAPGYQLSLYPYYYTADIRTDKDGNNPVKDLGLNKYGVLIGNSYYLGDFLLNAIIPVGTVDVGKLKSDDTGLGDIHLRAGYYLPVEWVTVLPALMVKVPTGSYDKNRPVNYGDGQSDLVAELYLFKLSPPFSFDAVLKYAVRFRNTDSDVTPGNEFTAEGLATVSVAEKIRIGPAINFLIGEDNKKGGTTLNNSGLTRLAVGGEVFYGRFDTVKISLAAYQDVLTRNTNQGTLVMSRITIKF